MTASVKPATSRSAPAFELKSAALNLIAFAPKTANLAELEAALEQKLGGRADFFGGDAAVIDLTDWPLEATPLDLSGLVTLLRRAGLQPVAARGGQAATRESAHSAGLVLLPEAAAPRETPAERPAEAKPAAIVAPSPALIVDRPVRSGQQVYARGGDLIVLALVSHGAELIADGNIHVYSPLRGRALAGARGDSGARIFTHCMEAELLSVAGVYRAIDEPLPQSIRGRAAQVRLDGNKLVIEAMSLD
ncbi:septum site-determining protein MinC [Chitinimonas koreensis]|uniref:septum site-determining protein MinC n=1 Tax=Chitinimonas koreensis TaxID=356302 RepID=UPI00041870E5|nr:septum site-determining protein MinC [Chitinimonas koreensis]QNM95790.1 septum site-determining protein MinC [Chitinimonas koreensis]